MNLLLTLDCTPRRFTAHTIRSKRYRLGRELAMCEAYRNDTMQRRATRQERWAAALPGTDADRYRKLQHFWANDQEPASSTPEDRALRRRYENEVLLDGSEAIVNVSHTQATRRA